jgi:hypothetical protein
MQHIFHIAERQREANVQHHRQADDLGTGFLKYLNEAGLVIPKRYETALPGSSWFSLTLPLDEL